MRNAKREELEDRLDRVMAKITAEQEARVIVRWIAGVVSGVLLVMSFLCVHWEMTAPCTWLLGAAWFFSGIFAVDALADNIKTREQKLLASMQCRREIERLRQDLESHSDKER